MYCQPAKHWSFPGLALLHISHKWSQNSNKKCLKAKAWNLTVDTKGRQCHNCTLLEISTANIAQKRNKVLALHWSISYLKKRTFVKSNNKKVNLCHMDQYKNKDDYICSTVYEPCLGGGELRCCVHFSHRKAQQRTKLSIQLIQRNTTAVLNWVM